MEKQFSDLLGAMYNLTQLLEERDALLKRKNELMNEAKDFRACVIEKYTEGEKEVDALIEEAEAENERNKAEIIALTKKQVKEGPDFKETKRLDELRANVFAYDLQKEAFQHLKLEVVISAADQEKEAYYRSEGTDNAEKIYKNASKIVTLLLQIKELSGTKCPALFDLYILHRRINDFQEVFKDFKQMRKEAIVK